MVTKVNDLYKHMINSKIDYEEYLTFTSVTEHLQITGWPYLRLYRFYTSLLNVILHLLTVKIIALMQFLSDLTLYSVWIASKCMLCIDRSTIHEYKFVLSCFETVEQKYTPTYIIIGVTLMLI